jgi:hypothetical protein
LPAEPHDAIREIAARYPESRSAVLPQLEGRFTLVPEIIELKGGARASKA